MTPHNFQSTHELQKHIALDLINYIKKVLKEKDEVSIILSGGKTPLGVFDFIRKNLMDQISWQQVFVYWLDERYVPTTHPESNFGNAFRRLFKDLNECHLFPIRTELPLGECCEDYSTTLKQSKDFPKFDYALIGVGEDGHIASLFRSEDNKQDHLVVNTSSPDGTKRISMTTQIINQVQKKVLIATGSKKIKVINNYLTKEQKNLPIHLLDQRNLSIHIA